MISLFDSLCVSRPADADACAQVSPFRQVGFAANAKANLELIAELHDERNRKGGRMDGMQHADLTNLPNGHSMDCGCFKLMLQHSSNAILIESNKIKY